MQIAFGIALVALGGRYAAVLADEVAGGGVELVRRDARTKQRADVGDRLGDERTRRGDLLDLALALADDHRLATTPSQRVLDRREDVVHGLFAVDGDLGSYDPVALDHQLRELVVEPEPVPDRLGRVVGASFLDRTAAEALRRDLVGDLKQDHGVERLADLLEHRVERFRLRDRPREAVQHEPVLVGEALADQTDHQLVRNEVAALEDRAHLRAELRPVGDRGAQDVARRDVRNVVRRGDPLGLRPLAGALWAENEYPHRSLGRYLRKPS